MPSLASLAGRSTSFLIPFILLVLSTEIITIHNRNAEKSKEMQRNPIEMQRLLFEPDRGSSAHSTLVRKHCAVSLRVQNVEALKAKPTKLLKLSVKN